MGSMVHKMLELLARKKLATQNSEASFIDDELGKTYDTGLFHPEQAADEAIAYYEPKSIHAYTRADLKKVRRWMYDAMGFNGGMWSPLQRTVIAPETYFDFTIDEPWARYAYKDPFTGKPIEGQLSLKGTIDLTLRVDGYPDTMELADWKTGARKDWGTGEAKDWKKLRDDAQLRLYHYALTRIFPEMKHIIVTILFIADGGPFSLDFGPEDLPRTLELIKERFETIRDCTRPKLHKFWGCSKFCHYGKNTYPGTDKTICDHLHGELLALGMDKCVKKYGKPNAYNSYGAGGGVSNRDKVSESKVP
jgi:hypothetical protein